MVYDARETQEGFTLIELLVVMIVIGILATIAVPAYMHQRTQARDTESKSDLRQLASLEELHLSDKSFYGLISELIAAGEKVEVSKGVTLTVERFDGRNGYCLSAKHAQSQHTFYYDSNASGLQPMGSADCPTTTSGTPGDSVTG